MRPIICYLIALSFDHPPESVNEIAALVELVHHATLIVDDIEDDRLIYPILMKK